MDIFTIRQKLRSTRLSDIPLRVTFYARVSTDSDEQLNSLDNQIGYYRDYITRNPAWTFIDGYIDEGLSGMTTRKRDNFQRMVQDAKDDKFDLILTKEITRFARNTLDSIQYTRELLNAGVGVFFQNDNINTLDEDSELRLTIMSGIAQDELRKLSSRVKFGHQQAIKNSVVLGNSRIFGYRKDNGRLVIDEDEASMVRELFELYATGQHSMKQIENLFWERGYRNHNGKKIAHTTMSGMISNPKYKGYYVGNKVKVIDLFTKKQKFLPPEEWVMFKDETGEIVPAIISEELWDKANDILRRRSEDVRNRQGICNHANLLTGKLWCSHCGKPYYRRESKSKDGNINSRWVCSGKINNGKTSCPSFSIYEDEIKPILFDVFRDTRADVEALLNEYYEIYKTLDGKGTVGREIAVQREIINKARRKSESLLELYAANAVSIERFKELQTACDEEISDAEEIIRTLEEELLSENEYRRHMNVIKETLETAKRDAESGIISKDFVDRYIDRIYVTVTNDDICELKIKIFTGKNTKRVMSKLRKKAEARGASCDSLTDDRMGVMSKKMIENAEHSMK